MNATNVMDFKTKRLYYSILVIVIISLLAFCYWLIFNIGDILWGFHTRPILAPYKELIRQHATEQEVVRRMGKPSNIITNSKELSELFTSWEPRPVIPARLEYKVLVYSTKSWDGDVVYVFINQKGVVTQAVMGVT